ncbi:Chitin synthase, class 2 [Coelomomyces lativittatus]|nr:Chitin synthase, class 2 [Coelomomyces lativittatus]
MYNEDEVLFTKTFQAINKNIQHMCNKKEGPFCGEHGWKKIVVCIVSDGRLKINKGVLTVLATLGCYQEGVCVPKFMNKDTQAHLFEFTTQLAVASNLSLKTARDGVVPVQLLFCLKEKNQKKINSHRWFFNAFATVLQPNVCVLVDVGTKPRREAIYRLWRCFDTNAQVGGACGEIAVEYNSIFHLLKPIIAAQNFEYKMSNILDKPLESFFGYISVLPGAFSAYRYKALLGRPLEQYFQGEKLHDSGDVFAANMYLAEDRILCFELIAKRNENWILTYEKSSQALTDVPDSFPEFISQRRRWLNGSTFALLYALGNVFQVYTSGQSFLRVVVFTIEFLYMALNFVFNYFALANFYLAYFFLSTGFVDIMMNPNSYQAGSNGFWGFPTQPLLRELLKSVLGIFRSIYILSLCTTFIAALGNRPQAAKYIYLFAINLFAIITGFMFYMIIVTTALDFPDVTKLDWSLSNTQTLRFIVTLVSIAATYGTYFLMSFLYGDPWHMFTSFIQYMFLLPTYVNVLQIYAYCNISDVTWGTKGDNVPNTDAGVQVKTGSDGQALADVELPSQHPQDVQLAYQSRIQALNALKNSNPVASKPQFSSEDYFKQFRTIWLLIWIIFNGGLVSVLVAPNVMGIGISPGRYYLNGLFIAVTGFL